MTDMTDFDVRRIYAKFLIVIQKLNLFGLKRNKMDTEQIDALFKKYHNHYYLIKGLNNDSRSA